LEGSPNLGRALAREKADAEKTALSAEQRDEVKRLDELIQQAIKCCTRGMTVKGKRNPAFANLATLVKTRKQILESRGSAPSNADMLAEIDEVLKAN
jgi:hypothetical protein